MAEPEGNARPRMVGRYELHGEIARGGMATVHLGRIVSDVGFSRTVAIKCLHAHYAKDPAFADMFIDEARLAARIHHPNVVSTLDVVATEGGLFVVMDYVMGESFSYLMRVADTERSWIPLEYISTIATGMLDGLHAAHEAKNEQGQPLGIVHRDVSPQNVLVGVDGIPRVIDFGVAKATGRLQTTREGQLKGKLRYMPVEQIEGQPIDRRGDVYSASVVLWEALASRRLFEGQAEAETLRKILRGATEPPSVYAPHVPPALDDIVMRGLATDPAERFATAREMALAIEKVVPPAPTRRVGEWVQTLAAGSLGERSKRIAEIESQASSGVKVAAITGGDQSEWRTLSERASAPPNATTLKVVPKRAPQSSAPPPPESSSARRKRPRSEPPDSSGDLGGPRSSLTVDTPVHPIYPSSIPRPRQSSAPAMGFATPPPPAPVSRPQLADPPSSPALEPSSSATPSSAAPWKERKDAAGWNMAVRPISRVSVALFGAFVLILAGGMVSQRALFPSEVMIGTGVGVLIGVAIILRMLRWTSIGLDSKQLLIEHRPNGRSSMIATPRIARFIFIDEGPGKDPDAFHVHILPVEGDALCLDVAFNSEADARFAVRRFNEMLADVRGANARGGVG